MKYLLTFSLLALYQVSVYAFSPEGFTRLSRTDQENVGQALNLANKGNFYGSCNLNYIAHRDFELFVSNDDVNPLIMAIPKDGSTGLNVETNSEMTQIIRVSLTAETTINKGTVVKPNFLTIRKEIRNCK